MEDPVFLRKAESQIVSDATSLLRLKDKLSAWTVSSATGSDDAVVVDAVDIISVVRTLTLNGAPLPAWLAKEYDLIEAKHKTDPIVALGRVEKLITQVGSSLVTLGRVEKLITMVSY